MGAFTSPITFFQPGLNTTILFVLTPQGHVLYPTSICLSDYLAEHAAEFVQGRNVLELGAGGGLPSLVCALEGAKNVRLVLALLATADYASLIRFRLLCRR